MGAEGAAEPPGEAENRNGGAGDAPGAGTGGLPSLEEGREILASAGRVVVLTGAGVSAESGVPTFRGEAGLWRRFRPEELATPEAFGRDPVLVWEWYVWRRERIAACAPNAAHRALARRCLGGGWTLVTQNVDGLHRLAAREAAEALALEPGPALPIELHGDIFGVRCSTCPHRAVRREPLLIRESADLPRCPRCGAILRPDVVWFGEPLDEERLQAALSAAREADACLVVGTSAVVYPAAAVATVALGAGAALVEVNPEPTPLTPRATAFLPLRAAAAVPALLGEPTDL